MHEKDLIKQKADLVELVEQYVKLTKAGSNYKGLCPFHSEKSPSFFVTPEIGIYKCFGCGKSGDVFSWLMEIEGLNFSEALLELAKRTGVKLVQTKPDAQTVEREKILQALSLTKEFYHWLLTKHKVGEPALQYAKQRGITDESIKTFHLGWAPDDWDGLQKYLINKKGLDIKTLINAGLVAPRSNSSVSGYDRFRARLMFPLQNARGQTLGFSGRIVPGVTPEKQSQGKYINTPETELYRKRELLYGLEITKPDIKSKQHAVVVEGELDLISSWQADIKEVVAIKGSSLTEDQVAILKRYTKTLILALDTDLAGDQAARRGIQTAESAGLEVKVAQISQGKDPDDIARQNPQAWKHIIDQAVDVYQFLINSSLSRYSSSTAQGKRQIAQELLPVFSEISNSLVQAHWLAELARSLNVKEEILWQELSKVKKMPDFKYKNKEIVKNLNKPRPILPLDEIRNKPKTFNSRRQLLEELLIGRLLKENLKKILDPKIQELLVLPWIKQLSTFLQTQNPLPDSIYELQKQNKLPAEFELNVAESIVALDFQNRSSSTPKEIIEQLTALNLKSKLRQIRHQIAQLELAENDESIVSAQQEFTKLSSALAKLGGKQV